MTEEARKHSDTLKDKASRGAGHAKDVTYDAADSVQQGAKDTAGSAQHQSETAWQKVKEVVTDAYEHVSPFWRSMLPLVSGLMLG